MKLLYCSLVRSRLEYASLVWDPLSKVHIDCLERIQKKILRLLYYKKHGIYPHYLNHPVSTANLAAEFHLTPLEVRRMQSKILFVRALISGEMDFPYGLGCVLLNAGPVALRQRRQFRPAIAKVGFHRQSPMIACLEAAESFSGVIDFFHDSSSSIRKIIG